MLKKIKTDNYSIIIAQILKKYFYKIFKNMKIFFRQFLWIFVGIFFVFSLIFAAYFLGRQHGIEQVYDEEIPKMQIFSNSEIPLQENISDNNCIFENDVKKCQ